MGNNNSVFTNNVISASKGTKVTDPEILNEDGAIITPVGGAVAGQTEDQAKMQGTPAQKKSALQIAAEQAERLKTAPQEQQERFYEEDQTQLATTNRAIDEAKAFSSKMKEYGSLGQRVEQKVLKSMGGGTVPIVPAMSDEELDGILYPPKEAAEEGAVEEGAVEEAYVELTEDEKKAMKEAIAGFKSAVASGDTAEAKKQADTIKTYLDKIDANSSDEKLREILREKFEINKETEELLKTGVNKEEVATIIADFNTYLSYGNSDEAMKQFAKLQPYLADASTSLELLREAFDVDEATQKQAVADAIANGIIDPNQLTMSEILYGLSEPENLEPDTPIKELGDLTVNDMIEFAGENWYEMTPEQIGIAIERKREEIFKTVAEIQRKLQAPNLSPAMREILERELQKYAITGVLRAEKETAEEVGALQATDKVVFGGKAVPIKELLDDDNVKSMISDFLAMDDKEKAEKLKDPKYAEFYGWVDKAFKSLVGEEEKILGAIDEFGELQESNKNLIEDQTTITGHEDDLGADFMKLLGFDPNEWSTDIAQRMKDNEIIKAISQIKDPSIIKRINELSPEYKQELVDSPTPKRLLEFILSDEYNNAKSFSSNYKEAMNQTTIGNVFNKLFGGLGLTPSGVIDTIKKLKLQQIATGKTPNELKMLEKVFGPGGVFIKEGSQVKSFKDNIKNIFDDDFSLVNFVDGSDAANLYQTLMNSGSSLATVAAPEGIIGQWAEHRYNGKSPKSFIDSFIDEKNPVDTINKLTEINKELDKKLDLINKNYIKKKIDTIATDYAKKLINDVRKTITILSAQDVAALGVKLNSLIQSEQNEIVKEKLIDLVEEVMKSERKGREPDPQVEPKPQVKPTPESAGGSVGEVKEDFKNGRVKTFDDSFRNAMKSLVKLKPKKPSVLTGWRDKLNWQAKINKYDSAVNAITAVVSAVASLPKKTSITDKTLKKLTEKVDSSIKILEDLGYTDIVAKLKKAVDLGPAPKIKKETIKQAPIPGTVSIFDDLP